MSTEKINTPPTPVPASTILLVRKSASGGQLEVFMVVRHHQICLLYTSPSPRDLSTSRMPSSA